MKIDPQLSSPSRTLLVVGGAGGVGSIAIQIAKRVARLRVIATASRPASHEFCREMGADEVIDHARELAPQLGALGLGGVDLILDCADPSNLPQLIPCLNPLGTICCILGGEATKSLDLSALVGKRGTLTFELMFTRPRLNLEPERQGAILDRVADLLDQKMIRTTMTRSMDWGSIEEAHRAIEGGHTLGKIVLEIPG